MARWRGRNQVEARFIAIDEGFYNIQSWFAFESLAWGLRLQTKSSSNQQITRAPMKARRDAFGALRWKSSLAYYTFGVARRGFGAIDGQLFGRVQARRRAKVTRARSVHAVDERDEDVVDFLK